MGDEEGFDAMSIRNLERFWSKVEKFDGCWAWTAALTPAGYGKFAYQGKTALAHRLAYEDAKGPIPTGLFIDHACHNRKCVNPGHLRLATPKQNMENRQAPSSHNTSGVRGVHLDKRRARPRWVAAVSHGGKHIHVGNFDTIAEAEAAVIAKRLELFTHNDIDKQELTR
jgi:hypothetical protein